ncbi:MAG: hypothetical protein ACRD18_13650 [Terriglobia bacterium]
MPSGPVENSRQESGVALITTLLILSLMSVISFGMVLSVSSDMMINGYYRNYRGSFYAADSGLNVARQELLNQVDAQIPTTFSTPPVPASASATALSSVLTAYGQGYTSTNAGDAAQSWPGNFKITSATFALAPGSPTVTAYCTPGGGNLSCTQVPQNYPNSGVCTGANQYVSDATACNYTFNYSLTAVGTAQGSEQQTVSETGSIILNVSGNGASTNVSFAAFGAFIDQYPPCLGALIPGTMTGPMFTNGAWQFMPGNYIFTDPVGQANGKADYWFGGNCIQSPTSSYDYQGTLINPTFQAGLKLSQPKVRLPPNDFSQQWAVLDGKGQGESNSSPTNTDKQLALRDISGNPYPKGGASSGVFLPYDSKGNSVTGGGIYVEGDAQVSLSPVTLPSGDLAQVYSITQGATTTNITIDPGNSQGSPPTPPTTTMVSGNTTLNLSGVPHNLSVPGNPTPATMLYVNGNVTSLSGPGEGQPAIQSNTAVTITAAQNVTITGDVKYSSEPVTTTQNQIPGTPVDTLIPANENNNEVLGIFTTGGSIYLQSNYSDNNLEVDGSLAAISQGGSGGFFVNGYINTFNNIGGQIQNSIYGANMNTENTYFDRRFTSRAGFAPPWFPSTTLSGNSASATAYTASIQRIQWLNTTALQ